jgi:hypothetical protein
MTLQDLTDLSASGILFSDKPDAGATVARRVLSGEQKARAAARTREFRARKEAQDSGYRSRANAEAAARMAKLCEDPEYRSRKNARARELRAKRIAEDAGFAARQRDLRKSWRMANPDKAKIIGKNYYRMVKAENPQVFVARAKASWARLALEKRLFRSAKGRAAEKGVPFTIALSDIHVPARCPVLGVAFERGAGSPQANSPSLDRIDPAKGYVPGNVQVISHRANTLKNNATLEEIEALYLHMKSLRDRGVCFVESGNRT